MLVYELNYEIKRKRGDALFALEHFTFHDASRIPEPEIIFKKPQGMGKLFKKYITIKSSLHRNERSEVKGGGVSDDDEEEKDVGAGVALKK